MYETQRIMNVSLRLDWEGQNEAGWIYGSSVLLVYPLEIYCRNTKDERMSKAFGGSWILDINVLRMYIIFQF